ncbi:MAG: hypothetical protein OXQ93_11000 [Gemmatimonadota bacterium]|nr:hypothetical protein [Gemmatimonadota bacterium]
MAAPCSAVLSPEKTPKRTWPSARSWTSGAAGRASVSTSLEAVTSEPDPAGRSGAEHAEVTRASARTADGRP